MGTWSKFRQRERDKPQRSQPSPVATGHRRRMAVVRSNVPKKCLSDVVHVLEFALTPNQSTRDHLKAAEKNALVLDGFTLPSTSSTASTVSMASSASMSASKSKALVSVAVFISSIVAAMAPSQKASMGKMLNGSSICMPISSMPKRKNESA